LSYLSACLSFGLSRKVSPNVGAIWGLTTAGYILVLVWAVAVHRLGLVNPLHWAAAFCIGLLIGNLIYRLTARGAKQE